MIPTSQRMDLPPYAMGWYIVSLSHELEAGAVKPLRYFGKELVLFRTEGGEAQVLDAYCPHLGAHLGYGGKVRGESVECPFHAWKFDGQGRCTDVPYAKKIPPKARIRCWEVVEVNGLIMVWFHPHGEAPRWTVPTLPEIGSDEWTPYEHRDWTIRARNQEMAENGVDTAHFRYLHGTSNMPEAAATIDGHILRIQSTTGMKTPRGGVDGVVTVHEHGFGFTTTRFTGLVETLLVAGVTPIDDERVHLRFNFTIRKLGNANATTGVGRAFIAEITRQVVQDIPIWENKIYVPRPVLCDGDGPIGVFRKWARQFYIDPPAGGEGAAA